MRAEALCLCLTVMTLSYTQAFVTSGVHTLSASPRHRDSKCSVRMVDDSQSTRRLFLASAALTIPVAISSSASASELSNAVLAARQALDPIDGYIKRAEWDKCRTTLNNPPLGFAGPKSIKGVMEKAAKGNNALKGISQDVITNQRLLDTFCYNNVFVDEGRQVLGLKVDFDTPKLYLGDTKAALDQFLELLGE